MKANFKIYVYSNVKISFTDEYVYKCFKQTGNHEELLNYVESRELETHIDST